MGLFSSLFGGGSKSGGTSSPKTIKSDTGAFTTGVEEIVVPMIRVAFTPPAGFSPFTAIIKEQKATDVRIANPSLMGSPGMITALLYPSDGISIEERVEQFLSKASDEVVQRTSRRSPPGVAITYLHLAGKPPGKDKTQHTVYCFFVNDAGQNASLHCVGSTEEHALAAGEAFALTLRLAPPGQ